MIVRGVYVSICVAISSVFGPAAEAADEFPLDGIFVQGKPCKGDGTDPKSALVTIRADKIDSQTGKCTINERDQRGSDLHLTTTCTMRSGKVLTGKLKFTVRDDKSTLDMVDQDGTYKTVLNRCPAGATTGSK
jgi:hypothetical protein